jgi:exodeoxyribonuclease VII small subunit
MAKEKFEDALSKLEKIVSKLEEEEISLEESLKFFEEGVRLSRFCNQKLDEVEKKVEILVKDKEGALKTEPFIRPTKGNESLITSGEDEAEEESDDSSEEE